MYAVDILKFKGLSLKMIWNHPQEGDGMRMEPRDWDHSSWYAETLRSVRGRSLIYLHSANPVPGPAFKEWNCDLKTGTGQAHWSPMFEDYAVWIFNEWIRRDMIDGIYFDDVCVGRTSSLKSTAYEFPSGTDGLRMGFTFMGQRRFLKRAWRIFQAHGKTPGISATTTLAYELPIFSFCRYVFNTGVGQTSDFWNPDNLRILGGAAKWGTGMIFQRIKSAHMTPASSSSIPWAQGLERAQTGLLSTADALSFLTLPGEIRHILGASGVLEDGAKTYPWWLADSVIELSSSEPGAAHASVYATDDLALITIFNNGAKECDVTLQLRMQPLFGRNGEITWQELLPAEAKATEAKTSKNVKPGKSRPNIEEMDILGGSNSEAFDLFGDTDNALGHETPQETEEATDLTFEGQRARILIPPHDYRILEVQIK